MKLFLCVALVAGCAASGSKAPAAAAPPDALPRYAMDIALTPGAHELRVTGTLVVPSPGKTVAIQLLDWMTDVALTSEPAGAWSAPVPPPQGSHNLTRTLTLAAPTREVEIRFSFVSRAETGFVYHVAEDAMFAGGPDGAWYPQLTPDKALGTLRFHAPARYRVVAGGAAADEVAGAERITTVRYTRPTTFSFIAAAFIAHERRGAVRMTAYVLRDRPGIAAYLDGCSRALAVLTREFGAYPYDSFALVEVPSDAASAAGFSGASFEGFMAASSRDLDAPFNLAYFGHELGHQWWGNAVTRLGDEGGMLLDEGLAQYGSLRVVEELDGAAAAETYRRTGYPGYNDDQNGLGYLRYAAAGVDEPVATPSQGYSAVTHTLANSKGLLALDHLSRVVGRDRFRDALHEITERHAFRPIAWRAVQAIVEAHAGRALGSVFAEWFDRTGAPDWTVEEAIDAASGGRVARGAIVQRGQLYQLELDVALIGARDTATRRIAVAGARTPFTLEAPFAIERIEVDPHYAVLHWTPEYRSEAAARADVTRAEAKALAGDTDGAIAAYTAGLGRLPAPADDRYGVRFLLEAGYGRVLQGKGAMVEARKHLEAAVAAPKPAPQRLPWAYVRLAQIAAAQHDPDAVARYAQAAVAAEASLGRSVGAAAAVAALQVSPARP